MHKLHSLVMLLSKNTSYFFLISTKVEISINQILNRKIILKMLTSYVADKLMNTRPLRYTMDTIDNSSNAFPLYQSPLSVLRLFELIYFRLGVLHECHSKIFQVLKFSSISTTIKIFNI